MVNNNEADKGPFKDHETSLENESEVAASTDVWKTDASSKLQAVMVGEGAITQPKVRLALRQKAGYSVGHVYNDLCASMWFTYTLLYFSQVLGFSQSHAGLLVLIGQVADALCTPVIGLASDKSNTTFKICLYGRRKIWHLIGTLCVSISFPFLFIHCLGCEHSEETMQMVYYSSFIIVFQFGWASVQVAHLSLIPDLTKNPNEKTELSANRNVFTVLSNVCVYGIAWGILGVTTESSVSAADMEEFRNIAVIVTGIGILFSVVFHVAVKEPKMMPRPVLIKPQTNGLTGEKEVVTNGTVANGTVSNGSVANGTVVNGTIANGTVSNGIVANGTSDPEKQIKVKVAITEKTLNWKKWLRQMEFYKVAVLYMCTRLFGNLSQTYIALYLVEKGLPKDSVAYIPLLVYISGFVASLLMKQLNKKAGRLASYLFGLVCGLGFCVWVYFGQGDTFITYEIYGVAVLMGVSGSVMLITCLGITADLIGDNVQSGAFVFGAMSFADKLSNGIVVVIVQYSYSKSDNFYRNVLTWACGIPAVLSLVTIFTISKSILNSTKKQHTVDRSNNNEVIAENDEEGDVQLGQINEGYSVTEKY